jgi:hypothetical protein
MPSNRQPQEHDSGRILLSGNLLKSDHTPVFDNSVRHFESLQMKGSSQFQDHCLGTPVHFHMPVFSPFPFWVSVQIPQVMLVLGATVAGLVILKYAFTYMQTNSLMKPYALHVISINTEHTDISTCVWI